MPDIKLRDGSGIEHTYQGVDTITVPLADGTGTWTYGLTDEDLTLPEFTGKYTFSSLAFTEIIEKYNLWERIDTSNIKNLGYLFYNYSGDSIKNLSFDFSDLLNGSGGVYFSSAFSGCKNITEFPLLENIPMSLTGVSQMFNECNKLQSIQGLLDNIVSLKPGYYSESGSVSSGGQFSIPTSGSNGYEITYLDYTNYNRVLHTVTDFGTMGKTGVSIGSIAYSSKLNSIINFPVPSHDLGFKFTSDQIGTYLGGGSGMGRLSHITFATNNGQPYIADWKSQNINFAYSQQQSPGWVASSWDSTYAMLNDYYNIADDVSSSATLEGTMERYRRKKDAGEDDWCIYTNKQITYEGASRYLGLLFSRYNHNSAVETINSLPDTSAYLSQVGGTNTIKFFGYSGACTDEGGIKDLTQAEIQVATDKGWTVQIV